MCRCITFDIQKGSENFIHNGVGNSFKVLFPSWLFSFTISSCPTIIHTPIHTINQPKISSLIVTYTTAYAVQIWIHTVHLTTATVKSATDLSGHLGGPITGDSGLRSKFRRKIGSSTQLRSRSQAFRMVLTRRIVSLDSDRQADREEEWGRMMGEGGNKPSFLLG